MLEYTDAVDFSLRPAQLSQNGWRAAQLLWSSEGSEDRVRQRPEDSSDVRATAGGTRSERLSLYERNTELAGVADSIHIDRSCAIGPWRRTEVSVMCLMCAMWLSALRPRGPLHQATPPRELLTPMGSYLPSNFKYSCQPVLLLLSVHPVSP